MHVRVEEEDDLFDTWARRFYIGVVTIVGLFILLIVLGTEAGRALLLFLIVALTVIFGFGILGDKAYEAYEEYNER